MVWHLNIFVNCYLFTILVDRYAPRVNLSLQHRNIVLNHTGKGLFLVLPLYCGTVVQTI